MAKAAKKKVVEKKEKASEKTTEKAASLGKAGSGYEVVQDFTDYGEPKTEFKKGQDASGIHPSKLQKYIGAGFVVKKVL